MSRTLSQLSAGTIVWLDETNGGTTLHVPYIYLGLDESGNARLLRERAAVSRRMNGSDIATYSGCEADVWLENATDGFLSRFDAATMQALQNTQIKYAGYSQNGSETAQIVTIARRCFLLSYSEEGFGSDAAGSEGLNYLAALKAATGKSSDSAARVTYNDAGNATVAWMRSALSAANFRNVSTNGNANGKNAANTGYWLRPALSVLATTPVSDEGAEAIFLLPDGRRTWWGIEAAMSLGVTVGRPKSCKLMIPHDSFTVLNAQVCNNYGDASPTWIDCGDGQTAAFGTSKTADDWELGVKICAEASGANRTIGEPAMIVAFAV